MFDKITIIKHTIPTLNSGKDKNQQYFVVILCYLNFKLIAVSRLPLNLLWTDNRQPIILSY